MSSNKKEIIGLSHRINNSYEELAARIEGLANLVDNLRSEIKYLSEDACHAPNKLLKRISQLEQRPVHYFDDTWKDIGSGILGFLFLSGVLSLLTFIAYHIGKLIWGGC